MRLNGVKQFFSAVIALGLVGAGVFFVYNYQKQKSQKDFAMRISDWGPRKGVPRTIEDLQKAIAVYEHAQTLYVRAAAQTGTYWKILASRFQDKEMWTLALDALAKAISYTPDDEVLHYLRGLNASKAAKSAYAGGAEELWALAESAYLRAINLQSNYTQARYALAILYIYELDKPEAGIEQLLRYMEGRSGDPDAMFALARAYYMIGMNRGAVEWYDRGIPLEKDPVIRAEAEANRRFILQSY